MIRDMEENGQGDFVVYPPLSGSLPQGAREIMHIYKFQAPRNKFQTIFKSTMFKNRLERFDAIGDNIGSSPVPPTLPDSNHFSTFGIVFQM
jgi:hypothetical protein